MTDFDDPHLRRRLLEAAARILPHAGLQAGLLERAAVQAGCSPEEARVFFGRDEELVLAIYARLATDLESRVLELPAGTIGERFRAVMHHKFAAAAPYREALAALTATLLDPRHELAALSPQTEIIRLRVQGVIAAAVLGASDCPAGSTERLSRALYGAHLGLMLLWCQDRSPEASAAVAAVAMTCDLLKFAAPLLALPPAESAAQRLDGVLAPLLSTNDDGELRERGQAVLFRLMRHRRLHDAAAGCAAEPCPQCLALHLPRVMYFLRGDRPLHLLLPAFPAKSPSRKKTLGPLPDRAEEIALRYLEEVCRELQELHPPGAQLTICSDGHVFSDLVGVGDDDVSRYGEAIEMLIDRLDCPSLESFSMSDLYREADFATMRRLLVEEYAATKPPIAERAHLFEHVRTAVDGIQRFLFEERIEEPAGKSRTKIRQECRELAYRVVERSDAWGRLLADCFPTALRLSIHPQHPHSEKIGIRLGQTDDAWLTPWHSSSMHTSGGWKFIKAAEAIALGARLVDCDGRPSHFELDSP